MPVPLTVRTDLAHGGRWTSLSGGGREWLWSRSDPARDTVAPGAAFVDVGGVEECFPTVRGLPDHGDVWSRAWQGTPTDAWVETDEARLSRQLTDDGGAVRATYVVSAEPGYRFVHAAHALLDLTVDAFVDAAAVEVQLADGPDPAAPWPGELARFGPDDGTAVGMVLAGCAEVTVVDGSDRLTFTTTGDVPCSTALWRNLGGWPAEAPYRSTGVEPLVGNGFDRCDADAAAVVPESGTTTWTVTVTASRDSS